ncbi:MAG TPA: acetoacetate--CoA ligase [Anaeromyxobacteraceae bacterium]|nr:acetoacetate--CoA ligase [Anaeromyxobacteraceae bacterium]
MSAERPLWTPSPARVAAAGVTRFRDWLRAERGLSFDGYESLWRWSVTDLEAFWDSIWRFCGVISHRGADRVLGRREMPGASWFEGATLNYAEHLLVRAARPGYAQRPALIFESEVRPRTEISWSALAGQAGALTGSLRRLGVGQGDRVGAYMPNVPESVVGLLATTSLGAVWSSASPDMGPVSVLDRFRQIEPRVLLAVDGYRYGGRDFDRRQTVRELVRGLPSLEAVIFVPYLSPGASLDALETGSRRVPVLSFAEATASPAAPAFTPVPFDHPLWIVYSSGTTGMPKPIVHGHGGTVLENLKSCAMHLDAREGDRFFWFSSTSWIMWNLWVSTLAAGCTALQFDGDPGHPDFSTLWRFASRERADFFGVSPAFLAACMKAGLRPRDLDLSSLRTVGCTGSPLPAEAYRWVYQQVHPDVLLASISGGTDPGAAFLTSCPALPVYAGEMQCRGLGVAVESYDDAGRPGMDRVGELVVARPMPSMPLRFWGDGDGRRYFESYFDVYPGVWRHGDWLRLVPRPESVTGVIYGRSDSTINRHGIRMGTSEIYRVVEERPEIADSLVVDLEYLGRESYLALFVVLRAPGGTAGAGARGPAPPGESAGRASAGGGGEDGVDPGLRRLLLDAIREKLSARHVPDGVFAVPEVPRTLSGKKLEVPVRKILLGHPAEKAVNRDSMANPGSMDWFLDFARGRAAAGR